MFRLNLIKFKLNLIQSPVYRKEKEKEKKERKKNKFSDTRRLVKSLKGSVIWSEKPEKPFGFEGR